MSLSEPGRRVSGAAEDRVSADASPNDVRLPRLNFLAVLEGSARPKSSPKRRVPLDALEIHDLLHGTLDLEVAREHSQGILEAILPTGFTLRWEATFNPDKEADCRTRQLGAGRRRSLGHSLGQWAGYWARCNRTLPDAAHPETEETPR